MMKNVGVLLAILSACIITLVLTSDQHEVLAKKTRPSGPPTYTGPGDTVPPTTGGSASCPVPCGPSSFPFDCSCDLTLSMLPVNFGWCGNCPEFCGRNGFVRDITIGNIKQACLNDVNQDGIANLCLTGFNCPTGSYETYVYTTIPFQWSPTGVPTSGGGSLQICGMFYGFLTETDAVCNQPFLCGGNDGPGLNDDKYCYSCEPLDKLVLQVDCSCFQMILDQYAALGLYHPFNSPYLTDSSVVFSVLHLCCEQE